VDIFKENSPTGETSIPATEIDTLIESRDANFTLSDASLVLTGSTLSKDLENPVEIAFNETETLNPEEKPIFEHYRMFGGKGANQFGFVDFTGTAWLDGTEGSDTYFLTLSGPIASGKQANTYVVDSGTGPNDRDELEIWGGAGNDTLHLDANTALQQLVLEDATSTATFKLTYDGKETATLTSNAVTASNLKTALENLTSITTVNVTGVGTDADPFKFEMVTANKNDESQFFRIYSSSDTVAEAKVASARVTRITDDLASALLGGKPNLDAMFERPANETQLFNLVPEQTGSYTLTYNGVSTSSLNEQSTPTQIQAALNAIPGMQVTVTGDGDARNPFTVKIKTAAKTVRGDFFPIVAVNATTSVVSDPMDIADAAATVRPSASLSSPDSYQRVNYDFTMENVVVHGGKGNDSFISDDSMAAMYVYGDAGNDNFLIGRVLKTKRVQVDHDSNPATPNEWVDVVDGLDGVSPGTTFNAYFYGGSGDDYFEVNHNIGELQLYGESGDDTFFLKALLQETDAGGTEQAGGGAISAGAGDSEGNIDENDNDTLINYVENNRVEIFGGSGFDTVVVAGTALNDTFYIFTDNNDRQYLYGAGLKLENIDGIERLALVTGSGNDTVNLYGLNEDLSLLVNLGSGDDAIKLGGEQQTFQVTYPKSSAIHTVEHGVFSDKLGTVPTAINNDVVFRRRTLTPVQKQTSFDKLYKKWINDDEKINTSISLRHWDLLESNLTLALKQFAQGVERAHTAAVHGTVLRGRNRQNYLNAMNSFETALLETNPSKTFDWHVVWEEDFFSNNPTNGKRPKLPQQFDFNTLLNIVPPSDMMAGGRSLEYVLHHEYLRVMLAQTIFGDNTESDTIYVSNDNTNRVNPGWGYDPDLYHGDLHGRHHGHVPHIAGTTDVWIPENKYAGSSSSSTGKGTELYWDLISLFYEVQAPNPIEKINVTHPFSAVEANAAAAYRFDALPIRTVNKLLPANSDLSRIKGVVRLGGGTGNDSIDITSTASDGLSVEIKKQVLDLAEYTFNNSELGSTLTDGITHEDVQSALLRANKGETDILVPLAADEASDAKTVVLDTVRYKPILGTGVLNDLRDGSTQQTRVKVSVDTPATITNTTTPLVYNLKSHSTALATAVGTLTTATINDTDQVAVRTRIQDFSTRSQQIVGVDVSSNATFSLDSLNALLLDPVFKGMVNDGASGTSAVETAATAVKTALEGMRDFMTLASVNTALKAQNYSWTGDGALKVYKQNTPALSSRTTSYKYHQAIWDQTTLDEANEYHKKESTYGQRLTPLRDDDAEIQDLATPDTTGESRSLRDIEFTFGDGKKYSLASSNASLKGNTTEMEKAYVAWASSFDTSYYTYSYYGVDAAGNRALEAVAIKRLNQGKDNPLNPGTKVSIPHSALLDGGQFITASNWAAFANAHKAGFVTASTNTFSDASVQSLLQDATAFNQTLRPTRDAVATLGVQLPIMDGLIFDNGHFADIQSIQDDAGFFVPSQVQVLKTVEQWVSVNAAYVSGVTEGTEYKVTYDSVLGLNDRGLWFGAIEDVDLSFNAGQERTKNDSVTISGTRFIEDLSIDLGAGNNSVSMTDVTATTDITTFGGADQFTIHSLTGNLTVNSTVPVSEDVESGESGNPVAEGADSVVIHEITGNATINTGTGADSYVIHTLAGNATINGNAGGDKFIVHSLTGTATINGGDGDDIFCMNYFEGTSACNVAPEQDAQLGVSGTLNVHGESGSDTYSIGLTGTHSATINVQDKSPGGGVDTLDIYGTNESDYMLFRPSTVAAIEVDADRNPVQGGRIERLNYDEHINGGVAIYGRDGDDWFILDDNDAPFTIHGDSGNDTFQVGQLFNSKRNSDAGLDAADHFPTTQVTQGFLSNGISYPATLNGGDGDDTFNVNRNLAALTMNGDNDNDTFIVRSFVAVDPNDTKKPMKINGGQGADFISYTVNAPVSIEGGDGLDTLTIVGTEFGDDFVVTDRGVAGAGRFTGFGGIEKVTIDALQGNDTFFVESTSETVDLEIVGGLGSDTFNVAGSGGTHVDVVSNDLLGHAGLITHSVTSSSDPEVEQRYENVIARGLVANISDNDEASVRITPLNGPLRVAEPMDDPNGDPVVPGFLSKQYTVVLTRAPEEDVRITASVATISEDDRKNGGKGIAVNGSESGASLLFRRADWNVPQTITVTAPADTLAEGVRFIDIRHAIIQGSSDADGGRYDRLALPTLKVEVVDADAALVVIKQSQNQTRVAEATAANNHTDTYTVVLSKAPTADVTIGLGIVPDENGVTHVNLDETTLTFTDQNWHVPQPVTVTAATDQLTEGTHYARLTHTVTSTDTSYSTATASSIDVEVLDDTPGVLIRETGSSTDVVEETTSFEIGRGQVTANPDAMASPSTTFTGTFGQSVINEIAGNDSHATPQDLELSDWSTHQDSAIDPSESTEATSTTIPHITVLGTGDGKHDYYRFRVPGESDSTETKRVIIDLDGGFEGGESELFWNPVFQLLTKDGLPTEHFSDSSAPDPGSSKYLDPHLDISLKPGDYILEVGDEFGGVPESVDYDLHLSVTGHPTAGFVFEPSPVAEVEQNNLASEAQNLTTAGNFNQLFDGNVGFGNLDYNTPYTRVIGSGDGSTDIYQFTVTEAMINPSAGTLDGTTDTANTYYTSVDLDLGETGASTSKDDVWELHVNGKKYDHVGDSGESINDVVTALASKVTQDTTTVSTYNASADSTTLALSDDNGFRIDKVTQLVNAAGTAKRTNTSAAVFQNATVNLSGTPVAGHDWVVTVGGTSYSYKVQQNDTLATVASELRTKLPAATGSGAVIIINPTTPSTIAFSVNGVDPQGEAIISGTPQQSDFGSVSFSSANIVLSGTTKPHEKWAVTLDGTKYEYTALLGDSLNKIASELRSQIPASYTSAVTNNTLTVSKSAGFNASFSITPGTAGTKSTDTTTASGVAIALSGTPANGDRWTANVGGVEYFVDVSGAETIAAIATSLAGQINSSTGLLAKAEGSTIVVAKPAGGSLSANYTVRSQAGTIANNGQAEPTITFNGTTNQSDTLSLTIDSTTYDSTENSSNRTAGQAAIALAALVNADVVTGYVATVSGATLTISKLGDASITLSSTLTTATSNSTSRQPVIVTLGGSVSPGENWNVKVDSNDNAVTVVSQTLAQLVSDLAMQVDNDSGIVAQVDGNTILVTKVSAGTPTVEASITPPSTQGSQLASGTPAAQWSNQLSLAGPIETSDVWSATVGGKKYTYTVAATDTTLSHVATGLAGKISVDHTATANGTQINIPNSGSSVQRINSIQQLRNNAASFDNAGVDSTTKHKSATITLAKPGDRAILGERWVVTIHGKNYEYELTAQQGGTGNSVPLTTVASELAEDIAQDFTGATVSATSATAISIPSLPGSTIKLSRGGGKARAVFDIDGGGTTRFDSQFDFSSFGFNEYVTSTFLELRNSTGDLLKQSSHSSQIDNGSQTYHDPLIEYAFDTSGTYFLTVDSCRAELPGICSDSQGVAPGLTYDLNVSIENHPLGSGTPELNGKTLRIVEGAGKNTQATITGYNAETGSFTVNTELTLDGTSKFVVEDQLGSSAAYEAILTDTYEIVLTSPPADGETVTVNAVAAITKTYNSRSTSANTVPDTAQVTLHSLDENGTPGNPLVTFNHNNWNVPQSIRVTAIDDAVADGQDAETFATFTERVANIRGPISIKGGPQDTAGVQVEEPFMLAGETNHPAIDGNFTGLGRLTHEDKTYATLRATSATHVDPSVGSGQLGIDPRTREVPYEFEVFIGENPAVTMETLLFAEDSALAGEVDEFTVVFTTDWPDGVDITIPTDDDGSTDESAISRFNSYYFEPLNGNFAVTEAEQVDVLDVFNRESISTDVATLTENRITGLGLGPDTTIAGELIPGGIRYEHIEELNLRLGSGGNNVTIESTHTGTTNIESLDGVDIFNVKNAFGHTTIDAGAGADVFNISNDAQRVDQIAGLLTVIGNEGEDKASIDDSGDRSSDSGTLTGTSLRGLNIPLVPAIQQIAVRADGGDFRLRRPGVTTATEKLAFDVSASTLQQELTALYGLPANSSDIAVEKNGSTYLIHFAGELAGIEQPKLVWDSSNTQLTITDTDSSVDVRVDTIRKALPTVTTQIEVTADSGDLVLAADGINATISVGASAASLRTELSNIIPYVDPQEIGVTKSANVYNVTFSGSLGGSDYPRLTWNTDASSLQLATGEANVVLETTESNAFATNIQTLTIDATSGSFTLRLLGEETVPIDWDASEASILAALDPILNPNNSNEYKPPTRIVAVQKIGNVVKLEFRGEHRNLTLSQTDVDANNLVGTVSLQTRTDGINYFGLTTLDINLGTGNDTFNVQGTAEHTVTNVTAGLGNDSFQVSSEAAGQLVDGDTAPGHLNYVLGDLHLDAGEGTNSLFVSDNQALEGDFVVIMADKILGLATGDIHYEATGDFDAGLSIWTGQASDHIELESVDVGDATITTLYTGAGNDDVLVVVDDPTGDAHASLPGGQSIDRRLRVRTQDGADVVDASPSNLAVKIESGSGSDIVKGGSNDDIIHTGSESDIVFGGGGADYISAITDQPGGNMDLDDAELVFGDYGSVTYSVDGGGEHTIESLSLDSSIDVYRPGPNDALIQAESDDINNGGDDVIYAGDGNNIVIAGAGSDTAVAGIDADLMFGDNALLTFQQGSLNHAKTIDRGLGATSDEDQLATGRGSNVVFGGEGGDTITGGEDRDIVLGDAGSASFALTGELIDIRSTEETTGGSDNIQAVQGNDVVIGGFGSDTIDAGLEDDGSDVVVGDHGYAAFDADEGESILREAGSLFPEEDNPLEMMDEIIVGNGADVVIAGGGNDNVDAGLDDARDVLVGDYGRAEFDADGTLTFITTEDDDLGGSDQLLGGNGPDVIFGGADADFIGFDRFEQPIGEDSGNDVIFGDGGSSSLVEVDGVTVRRIQSEAPSLGGNDMILAQNGSDIVVGGAGDDQIFGGASEGEVLVNGDVDLIIGDNGRLTYDTNGFLKEATTINPDIGGDDKINAQAGNDIVIGGIGDDDIDAGTDNGRDIVLGDNGVARFDVVSVKCIELRVVGEIARSDV